MEKTFKSINEQMEILKSKGLTIDDEYETSKILLRENYFFVNGYRHVFMKSPRDKTFVIGATFRELYALFTFDRYFRNIIFKNILIVENNLKSIISYQLSKKYGFREKDYLNIKNFSSDSTKIRRIKDLIDKMKRQIRINGPQHSATIHYVSNYGYIPMWVLVKLLSFGIVSELFSILKPEDQQEIAEIYEAPVDFLEDFFPILANYRNLCAHEDILYDHRTEKRIDDNEYHIKMNIPKTDDEYVYGKNDLYALIIILKYVLSENDFREMMREIDFELSRLNGIIKSIPFEKILDRIGFPANYMDIINI